MEAYESFQSRILRLACVGAKEIISLISFSGTLWHPVDRFQFDCFYKSVSEVIGLGDEWSVNWNILAVSVRTIDVTGGSSGDNRMATKIRVPNG